MDGCGGGANSYVHANDINIIEINNTLVTTWIVIKVGDGVVCEIFVVFICFVWNETCFLPPNLL